MVIQYSSYLVLNWCSLGDSVLSDINTEQKQTSVSSVKCCQRAALPQCHVFGFKFAHQSTCSSDMCFLVWIGDGKAAITGLLKEQKLNWHLNFQLFLNLISDVETLTEGSASLSQLLYQL